MGAGAIGCYVGGLLAESGAADVTFVGRKSFGDEIAKHGLTLRELEREVHVPASKVRFAEDPAPLEGSDVVLCCVKSGATEQAADLLARVLRPEAVIVSLQNGLRNPEVLRAHLPENRVIAGIVVFNVVASDGGVFQKTTSGPIIVETTPGGDDQNWVEALRASHLEIEEQNPIAPEQWAKLVINLANAISALSGVPTRKMILSRGYRQAIAMVLEEALDVLDAAGIRPAKFRGVPLRVSAFVMRLPTPIARLALRAQLRIDPNARSSMWQDLQRRRRTEIAYLNGEVVRLAEENGVQAPFNRHIVEMIRRTEEAGTGSPELSAPALLAAMRGQGA